MPEKCNRYNGLFGREIRLFGIIVAVARQNEIYIIINKTELISILAEEAK